MIQLKEFLTFNNYHIILYFLLCTSAYLFIISTCFYKKNKRNLKSIAKNKIDIYVYITLFISFLLVLIFSILSPDYFLILDFLFVGIFLFVTLFIYLTIKYKEKYYFEKLKPLIKICPECKSIDKALNMYIKNTSNENRYDSAAIKKCLSLYNDSSIKLLFEEIVSYKSNQTSINSSIIFLLLGLFVGKFFENPTLMSNDMDGLIITLAISLIIFVVIFSLFLTYFILFSIESEDIFSIKINLLKKYFS
ncbi:hypothetical protein [Acetoanaerobium noterae]|uniref:hypothetical protein n=1 Tax=Acetoanaerobium noterae TaxID=745369 RepID=UPI003241C626